ncbi:hypothetical protein FRC03_012718 [Tulasnella sp. 419]|nr:hypothetical protein FRC03_012718 [Tulasnella sp. 419]
MSTQPKSTVSPKGLRTFKVKGPDEKSGIVAVGVGIHLAGPNTYFVLARPDIEKPRSEEDDYDDSLISPLWTRLSSLVQGHQLQSPDPRGRHIFWMKTYSENVGLLEQLVKGGIVEEAGPKVKQGFVEFPLVRCLIPASEMMKQCGSCERWEQVTDEKRMRACSRCLDDYKVYYCNEECQAKHWKSGYPAHKKLCGKQWYRDGFEMKVVN